MAVTGTGRDPSTYPDDEKSIGWRDVDSVVEEITALGRRGLALVFDITDAASVDAAVEKVVATLGRLIQCRFAPVIHLSFCVYVIYIHDHYGGEVRALNPVPQTDVL